MLRQSVTPVRLPSTTIVIVKCDLAVNGNRHEPHASILHFRVYAVDHDIMQMNVQVHGATESLEKG
jgi:hypothetical protein